MNLVISLLFRMLAQRIWNSTNARAGYLFVIKPSLTIVNQRLIFVSEKANIALINIIVKKPVLNQLCENF